ncbi:hypothetical protein B1772_04635 [Dehalococcoides mccartyi]|nr:hypothetical protein B1776_04325 [Dehalococcoides mccartyi]AQY73353.1 hypothetical protein B1772_04635 [Dehalococcoides mccartyi]
MDITTLLAKEIGRTERQIQNQAWKLGICKRRSRLSKKDIQTIIKLAKQGRSNAEISAEIGRSNWIVRKYVTEAGYNRNIDPDYYGLEDISLALGVPTYRVRHWIETKALKGQFIGSSYHVHKADLKSFICRYPTEIDGSTPDMVQLVEILAGVGVT